MRNTARFTIFISIIYTIFSCTNIPNNGRYSLPIPAANFEDAKSYLGKGTFYGTSYFILGTPSCCVPIEIQRSADHSYVESTYIDPDEKTIAGTPTLGEYQNKKIGIDLKATLDNIKEKEGVNPASLTNEQKIIKAAFDIAIKNNLKASMNLDRIISCAQFKDGFKFDKTKLKNNICKDGKMKKDYSPKYVDRFCKVTGKLELKSDARLGFGAEGDFKNLSDNLKNLKVDLGIQIEDDHTVVVTAVESWSLAELKELPSDICEL